MTQEAPEQEEVEGGLDEPDDLEPAQGTLRLADDADEHGRADWERAAAGVLRKARRLGDGDDDALVWERLTRTTLDGIDVAPLGTPALLEEVATAGRPTRDGDWDIRARHGDRRRDADHDEVMVDLAGGVTSLWLRARPGTDFARVLDEVLLDLAPVVLDAGPDVADDAEGVARAFLAHAGDTTLHPATNLGLDAGHASAEQVALARDAGVLGFVVDATAVHDRGASDAQELGWSMARGVRYLRACEAAGVDLAEAVALVEFRYAATDEQFATIAKLRAARRLWARVLGASGVDGAPVQRQHAVTSRPMMSRYDPYTNLLRTTVAAFAAGVGGADAVTVLPFDSPLGRPQTLGRRIARNTSALLMWESHLSRVADIAGGAYAVERLTDDLARAGWAELGRLDTEGDDTGPFEERVGQVVAERERQVARRTRPITGLTEFPQVAEEVPEREADGEWDDVLPWGAAFEALRDEPAPQAVFLATLGTVAQHTARATFAGNLLAAGGITVESAGATDGVDALVEAHAGQEVVCLAGADAAYDEWGEAAAGALRKAGATWVVVAGKPREWADDACAMGVDALEFLTRTRLVLSGRDTSPDEGERLR